MPTFDQVSLANTFNEWRARTNEIITEINERVVRVSETVTGNATVNGTFTAVRLVSSGNTSVTGNLAVTGTALAANGSASAPAIAFSGDIDTGLYLTGANDLGVAANGALKFGVSATYVTTQVPLRIGSTDVILERDAANVLALRNSTSTQTFRIGPSAAYLSLEKGAGAATVQTADATTLIFGTNATARWSIISTTGALTAQANTYALHAADGSNTAPGISFANDTDTGIYRAGDDGLSFTTGGARRVLVNSGGITLVTDAGNLTFGAASDLKLERDAANVLAQRNGTNAQVLRLYGTYTDTSNYSRLFISSTNGDAYVGTQSAGTGTASHLWFSTAGTARFGVTTSGHLLAASDNAYDIGASGATRPRNIYVGTSIFANTNMTAVGYLWGQTTVFVGPGSNTVQFRADADGVLRIANNAGTGLTRIILGSNDTSGIAIKKNSTAFNFRLGNDSADADVTAAAATFSGITTLSANAVLNGAQTSANTAVRCDTTNGRLVLPVGADKWAT